MPSDLLNPADDQLVVGVGEQTVPNNESTALHIPVPVDPPLEDAVDEVVVKIVAP